MISAQDFNNRLTPVGEYNADKIVTLFNSLIDKLRLERLRNLEQDSFLRLLIDSSPMGVMMLDFDGKIVMINNSLCRITGIKGEQDALGGIRKICPPTLPRKYRRCHSARAASYVVATSDDTAAIISASCSQDSNGVSSFLKASRRR